MKRFLSGLLIILVSLLLIWNAYIYKDVIITFPWRFNDFNSVLLLLSLIPVYFINSLSWYLLNKSLGVRIDYLQAVRIWMSSNFSRFIPGGIWQYVGRFYLATKAGIPKSVTSTVMLTEAILNVLLGVIVTITALLFWRLPLGEKLTPLLSIFFLVVITLFVLVTNPKLLNRCAAFITKLTGKQIDQNLQSIPLKSLPLIMSSFFMQFFIDGLVLFFLSRSAVELNIGLLPVFIGIFAISWLLGYLVLFAPSGYGVQELSLISLLSFYMPIPIAGVIAIAFRLCLLVSESLTLSVVLLIRRQS